MKIKGIEVCRTWRVDLTKEQFWVFDSLDEDYVWEKIKEAGAISLDYDDLSGPVLYFECNIGEHKGIIKMIKRLVKEGLDNKRKENDRA